jgi:hypothetical protein
MDGNSKFGKLANVEFADDGSDTGRAVAMLASGAVSMPEFTAWSHERDKWIAQRASASARRTAGQLSLRVSEKGGVSIYGLNARFPVTLYSDQWERLLSHADMIREFIAANRSKLSVK